LGIRRKVKISAPKSGSDTEPPRMIKGLRKLLNWAARTRKMSARAKRTRERRPSAAQYQGDQPEEPQDACIGNNASKSHGILVSMQQSGKGATTPSSGKRVGIPIPCRRSCNPTIAPPVAVTHAQMAFCVTKRPKQQTQS
jgi:hypothetical protein